MLLWRFFVQPAIRRIQSKKNIDNMIEITPVVSIATAMPRPPKRPRFLGSLYASVRLEIARYVSHELAGYVNSNANGLC